MHAINKRTGSPIVGTLERLTGKSPVSFDGRKNEDGLPTWEHTGGTDIFWDDTQTQVTADGLVVFIDENGHEVPHNEVDPVTAYVDKDTEQVFCAFCVEGDPRHVGKEHRPLGMNKAEGHTCATCGADTGKPTPEPGTGQTPQPTA